MESECHTQEHARSYKNLAAARRTAKKDGYKLDKTWTHVKELFCQCFGSDAHKWQVDAMEAVLVGLNSVPVMIAGTGAGKTMPFMMPLLLNSKNKAIIISPLKILQADQVCHAYNPHSSTYTPNL